jgi:hypothetical protein
MSVPLVMPAVPLVMTAVSSLTQVAQPSITVSGINSKENADSLGNWTAIDPKYAKAMLLAKVRIAKAERDSETFSELDLSNEVYTPVAESILDDILGAIKKFKCLKIINLGKHKLSDSSLKTLIDKIEKTRVVQQLKVEPSSLTETQKKALYKLAQVAGQGFLLLDLQDKPFGPSYLDAMSSAVDRIVKVESDKDSLTELDLSQEVYTAVAEYILNSILKSFSQFKRLKSINLGKHKLSNTCLKMLIDKIKQTQVVKELKVDPSVWTISQTNAFYDLAGEITEQGKVVEKVVLKNLEGFRFGISLYYKEDIAFDKLTKAMQEIDGLDLFGEVYNAVAKYYLYHILINLSQFKRLKSINLGNLKLSDTSLKMLIDKIEQTQIVNKLIVNPSNLTELQKKALYKLAQDGRKGLVLMDLECKRFGPLFTNYEAYFESKAKVQKGELSDITKKALELFKQTHQNAFPACVVDFGCGDGTDTVPLSKAGCKTIWAVDSDEQGIKALRANLRLLSLNSRIIKHSVVQNIVKISASNEKEKQSAAGAAVSVVKSAVSVVHLCQSHFLEFEGAAPVDFLVSSYTWPYRSPDRFGDMWERQLKFLQIGAIIVGQFFEKPDNPKENMTYHTEKQVQQLLEKDFDILVFVTQKSEEIVVHGDGSPPEFKAVYHVVARKKAATAATAATVATVATAASK